MFNMKWGVRSKHFIVDEKDVTTVITVINEHRNDYEMRVNNCGWAEEPNKWFIHFDVSDEAYGRIVDDLNKLGTFRLNVSPNFRKVDLYFERAQ